jgi:hypothetical protein
VHQNPFLRKIEELGFLTHYDTSDEIPISGLSPPWVDISRLITSDDQSKLDFWLYIYFSIFFILFFILSRLPISTGGHGVGFSYSLPISSSIALSLTSRSLSISFDIAPPPNYVRNYRLCHIMSVVFVERSVRSLK